MKINGSSPSSVHNTQPKKTTKKQSSKQEKTKTDSDLKISPSDSSDDAIQQLISQYVGKIAAKKLKNLSDSTILATAIQIVSGKLKKNKDAIEKIKKESNR